MMAWAWRICLFVVAAAVFALALAPARAFLRPAEGQLAYARVEGSIWDATLYDARIGGLEAGDVRLRTSLAALARGRLAWSARLDGRQLAGDMHLERGLGDAVSLTAPELALSNVFVPALGGMVNARAANLELVFANDMCRQASGRLESDATAPVLVAAAPNLVGQPLVGEASCVGRSARIALVPPQGGDAVEAWLELDGDGNGRWRLSTQARQPEVVAALVALGFAAEGEGGALARTGVFQWLVF
jgi:hypothetical protein